MTAIETALAHHDKQIHDLEDVIARQWEEIDRLKRLLDRAMGRVEALETVGEGGEEKSVTDMAAVNRPPHY